MVSPDVLINGGRNTIIYEQDPAVRASIEQNPELRSQIFKLFSTNHSPQSQASTLRELLCCLPQVLAPKSLSYENLFRILIVQFIDAQTFDLRSIKKTCIHIAHPDGQRLIPFDTYNMFYRDDLELTRLAPLRDHALAYV
jgi:hypothetical protein